MAKRKTSTPRKAKPAEKPYADAALIRLCIEIAAELGAYYASGSADPDGNNRHATVFWKKHWDRARLAIGKAAAIPAKELPGLVAKAAALQAIFKDDEPTQMFHFDAFCGSFADDVSRIAHECIEIDRVRDRLEKVKAEAAAMAVPS